MPLLSRIRGFWPEHVQLLDNFGIYHVGKKNRECSNAVGTGFLPWRVGPAKQPRLKLAKGYHV
jgi:hypothetical protein